MVFLLYISGDIKDICAIVYIYDCCKTFKKIKMIRKISIIVLTSLLILSCSSDNEEESETLDSIVGSWQPVKFYTKFKDGTEETFLFSDCQKQSRYIFKKNGSIETIVYNFDEASNSCTTEFQSLSKFLSGTWENLGDNSYKAVNTFMDTRNGVEYTETDFRKISFPDSESLNELYDLFDEFSRQEYTITEYKKIE